MRRVRPFNVEQHGVNRLSRRPTQDALAVVRMYRNLLAGEKACADPCPGRTQRQNSRQAPAVDDAASGDYRKMLKARGITCSMSRRGDCWDNAVSESFFSSLKLECVHREQFVTRAEARAAIFDYIEVFYNRQRRHSPLGQVSPEEFDPRAASS